MFDYRRVTTICWGCQRLFANMFVGGSFNLIDFGSFKLDRNDGEMIDHD